MFTLEQIDTIHQQSGKRKSLAPYLTDLNDIGVTRCDTFVSDGHSVYWSKDDQQVTSPAVHAIHQIAVVSDRERMLRELNLHEAGKTDYEQMTKALAESGVEKWTFDTAALTITYCDSNGKQLLHETVA